MEDQPTTVAPEVNRLYWQTGASVAEISNRLGISRRALYDLLEPLPAGIECASCGAEMHFANRSAKTASIARCLVCGSERELDSSAEAEEATVVPPYSAGLPRASRVSLDGMNNRAVMIASFAIAGIVVGAIATLLIRKRR